MDTIDANRETDQEVDQEAGNATSMCVGIKIPGRRRNIQDIKIIIIALLVRKHIDVSYHVNGRSHSHGRIEKPQRRKLAASSSQRRKAGDAFCLTDKKNRIRYIIDTRADISILSESNQT